MKVGFVGLGVMGFPMAGHLVQAGHEVQVYNRTSAVAQSWEAKYSGTVCLSPAEAAVGVDILFSCVGNDEDLRSVAYGASGILATLSADAIWVDHTTTSALVAEELATQHTHFIDAPVSGGQAGAENGVLTVMAGGSESDLNRARPIIMAFAKACERMGPVGSGQKAKMVNQICIAGVVQGLAEALHFSEAQGLDTRKVVEVISQGAAQSWQMQNRYESMLNDEYDHGFAVDWMRKDLAIVLEQAEQSGTSLPLTALVDQYYKDVQNLGGGRWDTSSLLKRLKALSNG